MNSRNNEFTRRLIRAATISCGGYFLRWRIRARIRRFFRPIFRRPRPVFFTPTEPPLTTSNHWIEIQKFYSPRSFSRIGSSSLPASRELDKSKRANPLGRNPGKKEPSFQPPLPRAPDHGFDLVGGSHSRIQAPKSGLRTKTDRRTAVSRSGVLSVA